MRKFQFKTGDIVISVAILCVFLFMFRLWPLILIALAVGLALVIKNALFPKEVAQEDVQPQQTPIKVITNDCDEWAVRYELAKQKISELVQEQYPSVQWIWESSNWKGEFQSGADLYIRLNKDGGYKRVKVCMQDWCVCGIKIIEPVDAKQNVKADAYSAPKQAPKDDCERIAFEWVETHLLELNERCNEIIGQGNEELTLLASELPEAKYWEDICQELVKTGLDKVEILSSEGIKIILK